MSTQPPDDNQMNATLERILNELDAATARPDADPALVRMHGIALVLADTRRILGRPLITWSDDPNRTAPARPAAQAAEIQARRIPAADPAEVAGPTPRVRVDPPRPVVRDRVAGTAPPETEALHAEIADLKERLSQQQANAARFASETWDLLADALGGMPPASRYEWELMASTIRDHRGGHQLVPVVTDQAIQIAELRANREGDATTDLKKARAERRALRQGVANALGMRATFEISPPTDEELAGMVAETAASLKRERCATTDLGQRLAAATKARAGLRAALSAALGLGGETSDADAVESARQMAARLASAEKWHEVGVEQWRAEDPSRRTAALPPTRATLVAWLLKQRDRDIELVKATGTWGRWLTEWDRKDTPRHQREQDLLDAIDRWATGKRDEQEPPVTKQGETTSKDAPAGAPSVRTVPDGA